MTLDKFNLNGRCALITGAAGLLGIQHADALLEIGATVILTDINISSLNSVKKTLTKKYGDETKVLVMAMDVTNELTVQSVLMELIRQGYMVNILINNAAIDPKVSDVNDLTEKTRLENFDINQWNLEISVGLTGAFIVSKIFGSEMSKNGQGVIINIASDLSLISPSQSLYKVDGLPDELQPVKPITYSVIKSGLVGLTRYLATYWADKGVRANSLSPGGVLNGQNPEFVSKLEKLIPMGRMAKPDEYKSAIQFLASDASRYMNGHNLIIDGGRTIW